MNRSFILLLVLVALVVVPLPVAAQCGNGTASVTLQVNPPDNDGYVTGTVGYAFSTVPGGSQSLYLEKNGNLMTTWTVGSQASGSFTFGTSVACHTAPITFRAALWEGPCGDVEQQTVTVDSRLTASLSTTLASDGLVTIKMPYTYHQMPGGGTARLGLIKPNGNDECCLPLNLARAGAIEATKSLSCFPPGEYTFYVDIPGCEWEHHESPVVLNNRPSISASVVPGTTRSHTLHIDHTFPYMAASDGSARVKIYDAENALRLEQTLSHLSASGRASLDFDAVCWPNGAGRVEVEAWCGSSEVAQGGTSFTTNDRPRVDVELDLRTEPKAIVNWEFQGTPGNVRVVMQQSPSNVETELGSFTPSTLGGSITYTLPPVAAGTNRIVVRAIATAAGGCASDYDAAAATCGCGRMVADPVDLATGNMRYSDSDPLPMNEGGGLSRVYDSREQVVGRFGRGWTSLFESAIAVNTTVNGPTIVSILLPDNDAYVFEQRADATTFGQRWPREAAQGSLQYDAAAGTYAFRAANTDREFVYSASTSRLVAIRDLVSERAMNLTYDSSGRPTAVADSWGAWSWAVTTDATSGLITSIIVNNDPTWTWTYEYTGSDLTRVLAPGNALRRTYEFTGGKMTAARDALGNLIESHDYDASGRAISSYGPSGDVTLIEYNLPGSGGETVTRVTAASGAISEYRLQNRGGTTRVDQITGGCTTCGIGEKTVVHDAYGLPTREQDASGSITEMTYDPATRIRATVRGPLKPSTCEPASDPNQCRMSAAALEAATLVATEATIETNYTYGDSRWRDRPTLIRTTSLVSGTRDESITYDASGIVLSRSVSGWTGATPVRETRTTVTALYDGAAVAAFTPGGSFITDWTTLPQPKGERRSIDGPLAGSDVTQFVYYPNHATVPAALRGRLAAVKNAEGHVTRIEQYDVFGNATRTVDANGVATERVFDRLGRLESSTTKAITGCDTAADPLCDTDLTSTLSYDGAGPVKSEQRPAGGVTAYGYDARGRMKTTSRGPSATDLRERIEYEYDPASGKKSVEKFFAREGTTWVEKRRESYSYTMEGSLQRVTHADNAFAEYTYDAADRVASVRDENHLAPNTTYAYDAAGRLITVTQALSTAPNGKAITRYSYDLHGNLTSVIDPNGNGTSYVYDDFGQMFRQTSPVTGVTTYEYDAAGQLVTTTDANGATTSRTYDLLGRVLTVTSQRTGTTTETVTWTYDATTAGAFAIGRPSTMTDPAGSTSYSYERRGLLRAETRSFPETSSTYTTTYRYDSDGNRSAVSYPSGLRTITYTHDYAGRPLTASGIITAAEYKPFGPLTRLSFANGTTQTMTYDTRYRIESNALVIDSTNAAIASYLYGHDPAGNITSIDDVLTPTYNRAFTYDDLNRLVTADTGAALWKKGLFSWDPMGNIQTMKLDEVDPGEGDGLSSADPKKNRPPDQPRSDRHRDRLTTLLNRALGRTMSFAYSGTTPVLSSVTLNDGLRTVGHDAAGNQTSYAMTRTYSARNYLHEVRDESEPGDLLQHVVAYGYDGRGIRVTRTESPSNGASTSARRHYFYSPELRLLARTRDDAANVWDPAPPPSGLVDKNIQYEIVWFGDRPVAQIAPGGQPLYTFADHLGTPILQTNSSRAVTWRVEYEPFGNVYEVRAGTRTDQPLRFPGQEVESTFEGPEERYNVYRWYASGWGRYTQIDPVAPVRDHFVYVRGNPLKYTDPSGAVVYRTPGVVYREDKDPGRHAVYNNCPGASSTTLGCTAISGRIECNCVNAGGCWQPRVSMWMNLSVWYGAGHSFRYGRRMTSLEVRAHETLHVVELLRRYDALYERAAAFEKNRYSFKTTCDAACWQFERSSVQYIDAAEEYVHDQLGW
ncbi:MAG TPA: RHS repeat-associated core domain-containing protein [Thermoanaerobaculia bacterium]